MSDISRILCPVDFSDHSVVAYGYALSLRRQFQARLFVGHVLELWQFPGGDFIGPAESVEKFCQMLQHEAERRLRAFVKRQGGSDENHPDMGVQQGTAPDDILELARKHQIDLIVMGAHGRRGYDPSMLGPVTERVLRKATCPVLVVQTPGVSSDRGEQEAVPQAARFNKVLYCTDFSTASRHALEPALSIARAYNSELSVLHVLENHPGPTESPKEIADVSHELKSLIPADWKGHKIEIAVRTGKPYQCIVDFAQGQKADLIVLADRGRTAINFAIFGSTTHRVVQFAPCPVLVARYRR